jgi:ABC-2 type transport system ATP-binding protein
VTLPTPTPSRPPDWPAVVIRGLWKTFGTTRAVAGLDLDIPTGSFFGLVGPNGAGKTTTLRMLTGLLRPDAGRAWILGVDVWADLLRVKTMIGVLPDDAVLFERLTGRELLEYNGLLRAMAPDVVAARSEDLLSVLGLTEASRTMVVDYSTGMRKKVALACALIHSPSVLVLDEPFEAVDPVSVRTVQSVLERFCQRGGTVIFSSHVMDVVERLCDQVAIVHQGLVVAGGPVAELTRGRRLEDVFVQAVGAGADELGSLDWLGSGAYPAPDSGAGVGANGGSGVDPGPVAGADHPWASP